MQREKWDRKYADSEELWSRGPSAIFLDEVAGLSPGRALDLACGDGLHAVWLARNGWTVTGVDFSEVAIGKARERAKRDGAATDFVCEDVVDYVPEPEASDLVLVLYLHLPAHERKTVLERAAAAVAPGGTLLFIGHDLTNATEALGGLSDPELTYTPEEIAAELRGLEIEKKARVDRSGGGVHRVATDVLVRARRTASR